jgi:predicted nucleotidyltransferase
VKEENGMPAAREMTPEEIAVYQATVQRRWEQEQQELVRREEQAWEVARRAATLLREQFGATRVVVFGSLVHKGCFTRWSDVDIAAWGIRPECTFRAISAVMDMDAEIEVNLVDVAACRPSLLAVIEREGIEL